MLGVPTPNDADPTGDTYAFEKGAGKIEGGEGFADVWKRGHFAWEYKGKRKNLHAAYSSFSTARRSITPHFWSSATLTASRSTRTSPTLR
jgi:hypothetical protein